MKLGFIGTGNMATAMMGGIIKNQIVPAEEIIGADLSAREERRQRLILVSMLQRRIQMLWRRQRLSCCP